MNRRCGKNLNTISSTGSNVKTIEIGTVLIGNCGLSVNGRGGPMVTNKQCVYSGRKILFFSLVL